MIARRLMNVLGSRIRLLGLTAVLVCAATIALPLAAPARYTATASLLVEPPVRDGGHGSAAAQAGVVAGLAASDAVLARAAAELDATGDRTAADSPRVRWLRNGLRVDISEAPVLRLGVEAGDPELAARAANAVVSALSASLATPTNTGGPDAIAEPRRRLAEVRERLARLHREPDAGNEPGATRTAGADTARGEPSAQQARQREQIAELQRSLEHAQRALETLPGRLASGAAHPPARPRLSLLSPAQPPENPSRAPTWLLALIGLGAGLGVGLMAVVLAERIQQPVRDSLDLARAAGVPVLGALCEAGSQRSRPLVEAAAPVAPDLPVLTRVAPGGLRALGRTAGTA